MGSNNQKDFLESLFLKVLIDGVNIENIDTLTTTLEAYLNENEKLKDFDINYLLLNLMLLIKNNNQISPKLFLIIQELEIKILRLTSENLTNKIDNNDNTIEKCDNKKFEKEEEEEKRTIIERIKKSLFLKQYIPQNGDFKIPLEGKTGNLYVFEEDSETNLRYRANLEIDHNGKVVDIIEGPTLVNYVMKSYDEIYGGLLNDILMYSEESKYGE